MRTLWAGVLGLTALAVWLRVQPESGGSSFDVVDARLFLLAPIYLVIVTGLVLALARTLVHRTQVVALTGAVALFACALGIIWPSASVAAPWPWAIL